MRKKEPWIYARGILEGEQQQQDDIPNGLTALARSKIK